jgi:hypothetical protein
VPPHRPPFEFGERLDGEDRLRVVISANGVWAREGQVPNWVALEVLAQSAARLLVGDGRARMLAGLESVELPASGGLPPGIFWASVAPVAAIGGLLKISAALSDARGAVAARGTLILAG